MNPRQLDPTPKQDLPKNLYTPVTLPEEWPGDEAAKAFDFGVAQDKQFVDPNGQIKLPPSFDLNEEIFLQWKRPKDYFKSFVEKNPFSLEKKKLKKGTLQAKSIQELPELDSSPPPRTGRRKDRLFDHGEVVMRKDHPLLDEPRWNFEQDPE